MTAAELEAMQRQITELEATPPEMIGTDQGTGSPNDKYDLYETVTGERYAVHSFAGANGSRCDVQDAIDGTKGYIRWFGTAEKRIRAKAEELAGLRERFRTASKGYVWTGCRWLTVAEHRRLYPHDYAGERAGR